MSKAALNRLSFDTKLGTAWVLPGKPFASDDTASHRLLTYSTVAFTSAFATSGLPSLSIDPPDAQFHDMTSFWMPFGVSSDSGTIQPLTSPPPAVTFFAAAMNSVRLVGGAVTPAFDSRSS